MLSDLLKKTFVGAYGPLDARIAFIGEAPGVQEERSSSMRIGDIKTEQLSILYMDIRQSATTGAAGKPFIGASGQLFDQLLGRAGLSRKDCYFTNVIKERPANNDIEHFINLKRKTPILTEEAHRYIALLQMELSELKETNVFVAVGNAALYALAGLTAISKRRGSILECTLVPGKKVIPLIHPSAALREYLFTHPIVWDLKRIKKQSEFPEIRRVDRQLLIRPSLNDVLAFLTALTDQKWVSYDIEVLNEEISCLSMGCEDFGTMSIPFLDENGDYWTNEQEIEIWSAIATVLEDSHITKIGQNINFDATFTFRKLGIKIFPVEDTMVAQGVAFPDFPKGLDFLTSVYTEEPYYKDEGKKAYKLGVDSWETYWRYNAKDSAVLPDILRAQTIELKRQGNLESYKDQVRLIEPLVYIQERGILVDRAGLLAESQNTEIKISELTSELHACCGFELNPQSPKQLKEYFYKTKNFRPYVDRKTGEVTTNRDALKRLARKGSREAMLLLELRKHSKLKSTYLDMNIDPDNRLRCAFNPVGASSLRLSSSQTIFGTGGNMQNLPPAFKRFMLFDEGYIGYNVDLSQAENRCVAYIAPDPMMIRAFEENLDIHSLTGALISGLTYDEVKKQDDEGIYCSIGGGLYTWRFWGKKANHGLNYDLGYKTFAFYYEIPENESKFIVESYHRAYPGVRQYHAWIRARLSRDRTLESPFGSRRLFLDRWGDTLYKEAYSWIPQHTIARKLNKQGLCPAYYNAGFEPIDLLNQVHDSLVFQIPISTPLHEHARMLVDLRKSLETPLEWRGSSFVIPMDLEATIGGGNMGKFDAEKNPKGLRKIKGHSISEISTELEKLT